MYKPTEYNFELLQWNSSKINSPASSFFFHFDFQDVCEVNPLIIFISIKQCCIFLFPTQHDWHLSSLSVISLRSVFTYNKFPFISIWNAQGIFSIQPCVIQTGDIWLKESVQKKNKIVSETCKIIHQLARSRVTVFSYSPALYAWGQKAGNLLPNKPVCFFFYLN